jgi:hypothetical protein
VPTVCRSNLNHESIGRVHTKSLDWILNWMRLDAVDPRFLQNCMNWDDVILILGGAAGCEGYDQLECRNNRIKFDANLWCRQALIIDYAFSTLSVFLSISLPFFNFFCDSQQINVLSKQRNPGFSPMVRFLYRLSMGLL